MSEQALQAPFAGHIASPIEELSVALTSFEAEFQRMDRLTAVFVDRHLQTGSTIDEMEAFQAWAKQSGVGFSTDGRRDSIGLTARRDGSWRSDLD